MMEKDRELDMLMRRKFLELISRKHEADVESGFNKGPIEVNDLSEFNEWFRRAQTENKPVFVDFWAAWCMPCLMMAPIYKRVAKATANHAYFLKVNVDNLPGVAQKYGVRGIPTVIAFLQGKPVDQIVGLTPEDYLASWVRKIVDLSRRV